MGRGFPPSLVRRPGGPGLPARYQRHGGPRDQRRRQARCRLRPGAEAIGQRRHRARADRPHHPLAPGPRWPGGLQPAVHRGYPFLSIGTRSSCHSRLAKFITIRSPAPGEGPSPPTGSGRRSREHRLATSITRACRVKPIGLRVSRKSHGIQAAAAAQPFTVTGVKHSGPAVHRSTTNLSHPRPPTMVSPGTGRRAFHRQ